MKPPANPLSDVELFDDVFQVFASPLADEMPDAVFVRGWEITDYPSSDSQQPSRSWLRFLSVEYFNSTMPNVSTCRLRWERWFP